MVGPVDLALIDIHFRYITMEIYINCRRPSSAKLPMKRIQVLHQPECEYRSGGGAFFRIHTLAHRNNVVIDFVPNTAAVFAMVLCYSTFYLFKDSSLYIEINIKKRFSRDSEIHRLMLTNIIRSEFDDNSRFRKQAYFQNRLILRVRCFSIN